MALEKPQSQKETYDVITNCTNCGEQNQVDIPKGTLKTDYTTGYICTNCGCKILFEGKQVL